MRHDNTLKEKDETGADLESEQTSSPIHHPQHNPPSPSPRRSPAPIDADALLHPTNTDPKQMHYGWSGPWCAERFQDDTSKNGSNPRDLDRWANDLAQYNFRMEAMAGNLPGVKRASW